MSDKGDGLLYLISLGQEVPMMYRHTHTTKSAEGVPPPKDQTKKTGKPYGKNGLLQLRWLVLLDITGKLEKPRAKLMQIIGDEEVV